MKAWAASLALHGAAAGLAAMLWLEPMAEPEAETLRWQVALVPVPAQPAPPEPSAPPPAAPPPPAPVTPPIPPAPAPPSPQPVAEPPRPREVSAAPPPAVAQAVVPAPAPAPHRPEPADVPAPSPPAPILARPSVPTPTVSPDVAAEIERRWYLALLERLRAMKRYPMAARRLGQEGVVLVEARIGRDGRLEGAEIKHGSGYPLLDKDALRLLEAAAETARDRLQPERPTRLEIPIAYRLEG